MNIFSFFSGVSEYGGNGKGVSILEKQHYVCLRDQHWKTGRNDTYGYDLAFQWYKEIIISL